MTTYTREDQARLTVTVDGVSLGVCHAKDGGDTEADSNPFKPGGMAPQVNLGGPAKVSDIKLTLPWTEALHAQRQWLRSRVGKGAVGITEQVLDADGNPFGAVDQRTGILNGVSEPPYDAKSGDPRLIELTVGVNE